MVGAVIAAFLVSNVHSQSLACKRPVDSTRIHGENIYAAFANGPTGPAQRWVEPDLISWGIDERALHSILEQTRPKFIIEVGSWKGLSAVTMGKWLKANLEHNASCAAILCVDTWLGTTRAWTHRGAFGNTLHSHAGYPSIYYQFLFNVKHYELDDLIVPLPMPSSMGALYAKQTALRPDLIFIDACHDYHCVYADILSWFPVLRPGGVIFGDDINRSEVQEAVTDAANKLGATWRRAGQRFFVLMTGKANGSSHT